MISLTYCEIKLCLMFFLILAYDSKIEFSYLVEDFLIFFFIIEWNIINQFLKFYEPRIQNGIAVARLSS